MQKKIGKMFFVLEIIVCELVNVKFVLLRREYLWSAVYVLTNSLKTLHELKETFSNWIGFKVFSKYVKGGFQQCVGRFRMLLLELSYETPLFRHLSNHVNRSLWFPKYSSDEAHLFFQNVQNLIKISKMQKKIKKTFFVSEIIAYELVALNCPY